MQWDRNTAGRLERLGASIEEGCEVSLHTNQMETPPEEQQSQQGVHREPNAYRSMRDHIHPPRVSAPSCIIPPAEDVPVRPYVVPLPRPFMVWKMIIHTRIFGILRKFARLSRRVHSIWTCSS